MNNFSSFHFIPQWQKVTAPVVLLSVCPEAAGRGRFRTAPRPAPHPAQHRRGAVAAVTMTGVAALPARFNSALPKESKRETQN